MFLRLKRWILTVWQSRIVTFGLAGIIVFAVLAQIFTPQYEGPLPPIEFQEDNSNVSVLSGHIYWRHPIWSFSASGDTNELNNRSDLVLMEDGIPLGPAHSLHESIRAVGKGRYSHWGGAVYFSSSDNSNPATNGRKYTISGTLGVRWWVDLMLWGALCSLVGQSLSAHSFRKNRTTLATSCATDKIIPYTWWGAVPFARSFFKFSNPIRPWQKLSKVAWRYCVKACKANHFFAIADLSLLIMPITIAWIFACLFFLSIVWGWCNNFASPATAIFYIIPPLKAWLTTNALTQSILTWLLIALSWLWVSPLVSTNFILKLLIRILQAVGFGLVLCWCWLVLGMAQQGIGNTMASLVGIVPFSDANNYWNDLQDFFIIGEWSPFSSRRPFAAALRQCTAIAESYSNILFLQTTLFAVSLWLAVKSVGQWRGVWAAMFFSLFAVLGTSVYLPSTMTETPSMWLSLLTMPCLITGLRCRSLFWCMCALAIYCFAQLARMGAIFIIPFFFLWILWQARQARVNIRYVIGGAITIGILCLGSTSILQNLYADTTQKLGGNFSWVLAGLSLGGEWTLPQIYYQKELLSLSTEEKEIFLYNIAAQNIITNPTTFINALIYSGLAFIRNFQTLIDGYCMPKIQPIMLYIMALFYGLGVIATIRRRENGELLLLACIALGLLSSSLITMHSEGLRVMLAGYPQIWLFMSAYFVSPPRTAPPTNTDQHNIHHLASNRNLAHNATTALHFFGLILLAALIVPSLQAKTRLPLPTDDRAAYPYKDILPSQIFSGILVVPNNSNVEATIPSIKQSDFFEYLKKHYPHWDLSYELWPEPPFTFGTWGNFLAVGPAEILQQPAKDLRFWALSYEAWPVGFEKYINPSQRILHAVPLDANGIAITMPKQATKQ